MSHLSVILFNHQGIKSNLFVNHLQTNQGNIEWGTFLRLLEGATCDLPAPMNTHTKHIKISSDVPIFATSPRMFQWYAMDPQEPRTEIHNKEDEQIKERFKVFQFSHTIPMNERVRNIPQCPRCFSQLALVGDV